MFGILHLYIVLFSLATAFKFSCGTCGGKLKDCNSSTMYYIILSIVQLMPHQESVWRASRSAGLPSWETRREGGMLASVKTGRGRGPNKTGSSSSFKLSFLLPVFPPVRLLLLLTPLVQGSHIHRSHPKSGYPGRVPESQGPICATTPSLVSLRLSIA